MLSLRKNWYAAGGTRQASILCNSHLMSSYARLNPKPKFVSPKCRKRFCAFSRKIQAQVVNVRGPGATRPSVTAKPAMCHGHFGCKLQVQHAHLRLRPHLPRECNDSEPSLRGHEDSGALGFTQRLHVAIWHGP